MFALGSRESPPHTGESTTGHEESAVSSQLTMVMITHIHCDTEIGTSVPFQGRAQPAPCAPHGTNSACTNMCTLYWTWFPFLRFPNTSSGLEGCPICRHWQQLHMQSVVELRFPNISSGLVGCPQVYSGSSSMQMHMDMHTQSACRPVCS